MPTALWGWWGPGSMCLTIALARKPERGRPLAPVFTTSHWALANSYSPSVSPLQGLYTTPVKIKIWIVLIVNSMNSWFLVWVFLFLLVFFIGHPDFQSPKTLYPSVGFLSFVTPPLLQNWKTSRFSESHGKRQNLIFQMKLGINKKAMNFMSHYYISKAHKSYFASAAAWHKNS